jgi:hypothetical protein
MSETERRFSATTRPKSKDFHPGYSAVLVRSDLKDSLRQFRRDKGFGHDSHIERCLMSAAIEMLLTDSGLHGRWIEMLGEATRTDVLLASQQQIRAIDR